jgi:predicted phosphodiesterase
MKPMSLADQQPRLTFGRRGFVVRAAQATLTTLGLGYGTRFDRVAARDVVSDGSPKVAFIVVGDTHYLADKLNPAKMDVRSQEVCGRLVETLNRLPGTEIPVEAGGGRVAQSTGLIHAGDIIDTGDKNGRVQEEMQRTEWAAFRDDYGLSGTDGRLRMPVYEVFGNHDAPHGAGHALEQIRERNKRRPGVVNVSDNGVHYSWDWGPAHFVNLGIVVGNIKSVERKRRYAALDSLDFLIADLKEKVGTSRRPIVITHHVDLARYTGPCDPNAPADSKEWDPCDVRAFYDALQDYNVAGIFYGHTHFREVFQWDGMSKKAAAGLNVFNTDNASHFSGAAQAFFYVELDDNSLTVREFMTKDGWQSGTFTPKCWTASSSRRATL